MIKKYFLNTSPKYTFDWFLCSVCGLVCIRVAVGIKFYCGSIATKSAL